MKIPKWIIPSSSLLSIIDAHKEELGFTHYNAVDRWVKRNSFNNRIEGINRRFDLFDIVIQSNSMAIKYVKGGWIHFWQNGNDIIVTRHENGKNPQIPFFTELDYPNWISLESEPEWIDSPDLAIAITQWYPKPEVPWNPLMGKKKD